MGLPLDAVKVKDWILCTRGPLQKKFTSMGEVVEVVNHEPEGTLMEVLAVSFPMVLVRVHPVPCADENHDHKPFNTTVRWSELEFTRPSPGYRRTYLRLSRRRTKPQPRQLRARNSAFPSVFDIPDDDLRQT